MRSGGVLARVRCWEPIPWFYTWFFHARQAWKSHGILEDAPYLLVLRSSGDALGCRPASGGPVGGEHVEGAVDKVPHILEPPLASIPIIDRGRVEFE